MSTTVLPSTVEAGLQVVRSTAPKYWKGESDLTLRNRLAMALMEKYGVIELNANHGYVSVWTVKYKEPGVTPFTNRQDIQFTTTQNRIQLTIEPRYFKSTESISYHEAEQNAASDLQIIKLADKKIEDLKMAMQNAFCALFYNDGYTNTSWFHGLESFMGTGTTVTADKVAQPSDTYGGLSTALAAQNGTWSANLSTSPNANAATDWPFGKGDPQYDFISPLVLNTSSSSWENGTEWIDNCEEIMQYMKNAQTHRCGKMKSTQSPYVHLLANDLFNDFESFLRPREQMTVPVEAEEMGFATDVWKMDGTWVTRDYDVTPGTGYYICPEMMEFFTAKNQLFSFEGPVWSTPNQAYLMISICGGNYRFQPKFFGKYAAVA